MHQHIYLFPLLITRARERERERWPRNERRRGSNVLWCWIQYICSLKNSWVFLWSVDINFRPSSHTNRSNTCIIIQYDYIGTPNASILSFVKSLSFFQGYFVKSVLLLVCPLFGGLSSFRVWSFPVSNMPPLYCLTLILLMQLLGEVSYWWINKGKIAVIRSQRVHMSQWYSLHQPHPVPSQEWSWWCPLCPSVQTVLLCP